MSRTAGHGGDADEGSIYHRRRKVTFTKEWGQLGCPRMKVSYWETEMEELRVGGGRGVR